MAAWPGFTDDALATLVAHDWPGNVRELRNVVERAVYRADGAGDAIGLVEFDPFASPWRPRGAAALPAIAVSPGPAAAPAPVDDDCADFRAAVEAYERRLLQAALARSRYNQRATAASLALTYDQLRHALRRHGLIEAKSD